MMRRDRRESGVGRREEEVGRRQRKRRQGRGVLEEEEIRIGDLEELVRRRKEEVGYFF